MDTLTADEARENFRSIIQSASQELRRFRITSEEGSVVLLPEETYDNLLVTLELLSTPGLMEGLKAANQPFEGFSPFHPA